ncbi:MAG: LacI family DNA-binding transcriptional regulator [bacterium]
MATTIKDVAQKADVSISTVSKYLNGGNVLEENRVLIDKAIRKLNYRINEIARGLKTNQTMAIGVLVPSFEDNFCAPIVSQIEEILQKNGYSLVVCDYRKDGETLKGRLDFLVNKMVDGLIIFPLDFGIEYIESVLEKDIPLILIDQIMDGIDCDAIVTDNVSASYTAVEHLIHNGHKRIGIICGTKDLYTSQERPVSG